MDATLRALPCLCTWPVHDHLGQGRSLARGVMVGDGSGLTPGPRLCPAPPALRQGGWRPWHSQCHQGEPCWLHTHFSS